MRNYRTMIGWTLAALMLAGCNLSLASSASGVPEAWIDAPLNGATLPLGPVDVVWHAAASKGVELVEFGVNGAPVEATPPGNVGAAFVTGTRTWSPPAAGNYVLHVRAQGKGGAWGAVRTAQVTVRGELPPAPGPTPASASTPPPAPACSDKMNVVFEDPLQKTDMTPGQVFTKSWTIQNTGTCAWGEGYHLVFAGGPSMSEGAASMGAPLDTPLASLVSVPVLPDQQVILQLGQTAPASEGWYVGAWNLVSPNGDRIPILYGGDTMPSMYVDIVVRGNTSTPSPAPAQASIEVARVSTDRVSYEGGGSCAPTVVTILVRASDPAGIRAVVVFYRISNKDSGEATEFSSRAMDPQGGDLYSITIDPNAEIISRVGFPGSGEGWLQYQAVIQNAQGDTGTRTLLQSDITVVGC